MAECWKLFFVFLKIGFVSFGGGYAMLSMIMAESRQFSITPVQLADLNALDMVVPGAIAINAATYVGDLHMGLPGAVAATLGVSVPSVVYAIIIMRFFAHFQGSVWLADILSAIKPAAVGLIAAASISIAANVLTIEGKGIADLTANPIGSLSLVCSLLFVLTAVLNIRFKMNPILLTILAGVAGAVFMA